MEAPEAHLPYGGNEMQIPSLHDVVLVDISIEWKTGVIELALREAKGRSLVRGRDVHLFKCPRMHPWGPSVCINDAEAALDGNGRWMLKIQMQSGDELVVNAKELEYIDPAKLLASDDVQ